MSWKGFDASISARGFARRGVFAGGFLCRPADRKGDPDMTLHKFMIGQAVDFDTSVRSMSKLGGPYEVVGVLPVDEANFPTYRVKSKAEPFARAARETDLVAVGSPPGQRKEAAVWARPVSGGWLSRAPRSR